MKNDCIEITIAGHRALVDPKGIIIEADEKISKLQYQRIKEVFKKYRRRAAFKKERQVPYPLTVSDDIYKEMVKKNPSLAKLKDKFDCTIF